MKEALVERALDGARGERALDGWTTPAETLEGWASPAETLDEQALCERSLEAKSMNNCTFAGSFLSPSAL
ncbi:hypothetical protein ROHU_024636 [Labeo rohita]|uniref:Uncharacterized protein n=1 Tax=Labeo rohita TaxID=84645 RepID=A0A498MNI2_LABRO|nr:hypothetical protein ROHU_024636 [Labeo rohita]